MSVPITDQARVLFGGDSISAFAADRAYWYRLVRSIDANWQRTPAARHVGGNYALPQRGRNIVVNCSAVGGQRIADLNTNFATQYTYYAPTHSFVLIGVNDADGGTTLGNFTTGISTFVSNYQTNCPGAKLVMYSILCRGEVWTAGTPNTWGPNAGAPDATIDSFNGVISAAMTSAGGAAAGFYYVDVRAAFLAQEAILNPTFQASGVLTILTDGVHLSETGKRVVCDTVYAQLAVAP